MTTHRSIEYEISIPGYAIYKALRFSGGFRPLRSLPRKDITKTSVKEAERVPQVGGNRRLANNKSSMLQENPRRRMHVSCHMDEIERTVIWCIPWVSPKVPAMSFFFGVT